MLAIGYYERTRNFFRSLIYFACFLHTETEIPFIFAVNRNNSTKNKAPVIIGKIVLLPQNMGFFFLANLF